MTNRYIKLQGSIDSDATGQEIGSISPQNGEQITTTGFYTDQNTNIDYSIEINETTHVDPLGSDLLTGPADIVPFEVRLEPSDELRALADETGSSSRDGVTVVLLAEDTAKAGD